MSHPGGLSRPLAGQAGTNQGGWAWPQSFADYVGFPDHEHFLHDLGAFHFGIAVGLAASLIWRDSIIVSVGVVVRWRQLGGARMNAEQK